MLVYLEGHPLKLPCRYADKQACYTKVYIVSNWALDKQYMEAQKNDRETWDAFERRIHKMKWYTGDNIIELNLSERLTEDKNEENPFEQSTI